MTHSPLFGDGWGGTTAASVLSALAWITGGASPLVVASTVLACAVAVSKLLTDRAKRRAWADFKVREQTSPHPLRRASDRPQFDTAPGRLA